MHIAGKLLRGLGLVLGVLALSFVVVLPVLQTQLGKAWRLEKSGRPWVIPISPSQWTAST
jgi:hypothetical protein